MARRLPLPSRHSFIVEKVVSLAALLDRNRTRKDRSRRSFDRCLWTGAPSHCHGAHCHAASNCTGARAAGDRSNPQLGKCDWLACYERWLMTGRWTGGGRNAGQGLGDARETTR